MATLLDRALPAGVARPAAADDRYRSLLLLRFAILNAVGFALLAAAWLQGWLAPLFAADSLTHMCKLIFAVFLFGLYRAGRELLRVSRELDQLDAAPRADPGSRVGAYLAAVRGRDATTRATLAETMQLRLAHKIAPVRHVAGRLVMLGIIGTILGFIIALYGGVDPGRASDLEAVGPMVATVLQGIGMAFFKTLTGSVLNLWLMADYRLLEDGTVHLLTRLVELGERQRATPA